MTSGDDDEVWGTDVFGIGTFYGDEDDYRDQLSSIETNPIWGEGTYGLGIYGGLSERAEAIQELAETTEYSAFDTPEERLRSYLKPAFNDNPGAGGEEWDSYLNAYGSEYSDFYDARSQMLGAQYVDTAEGKQLDRIGELARLPRKTGEDDPQYRQRLIVQMQKYVTGGTIEDIKAVSSILLRTDRSAISIEENFDIEPARFDIAVSSGLLDAAGVTADEFIDNISEVTAAGVRPVITAQGSFEYRSYDDYQNNVNNPDKGYNQGRYAGYLTR